MAAWKQKIDLAGVLTKAVKEHGSLDDSDICPKDLRDALAAECDKAEPLKRFVSRLRRARTIASCNRILEEIYDEADSSLIWIGG